MLAAILVAYCVQTCAAMVVNKTNSTAANPSATATNSSTSPEAFEVSITSTAQCSVQDNRIMDEKGFSLSDGSMPKIAADCAHSSWSFWWGFDRDFMAKCVQAKTALSTGCADCFAESGVYGYRNCKGACLWSWCSRRCIDCAQPHSPIFNACLGRAPSPAKYC